MSEFLLAVVGKMHSGKTTLANALVDLHGYQRFAFADPVKDVSAAMLTTFHNYLDTEGFTPHLYNRDMMNKMKGHPAIRGLLQLVGTELGRDWLGPDTIWIDLFEKRIEQTRAKAFEDTQIYYGADWIGQLRIVNDDCRFPNEAQRLKELGFVLVKLHRNEDARLQSIVDTMLKDNPELTNDEVNEQLDNILTHPSETNVDLITADIDIESISVDQLQHDVAKQLAGRLALR